ncbi:helix-turn-helix domain-containing protein [Stenotrophomonas sp. AB1(2024)]|uniref:helix-turn-helix domain-containing protein n=1 Tax=Stenotrophomonas sp. AB1(2024) TaxID=3132215 RepID=UPI0030A19056
MDPSTAIDRLRNAGLTDQAIGTAVGAHQSTINRIRNGDTKQPNYEVGRALVVLAESMAGEESAGPPTQQEAA